ncbi:GatB/GatE catalytic domain-containing protein [Lophiotrema nucula]|uniref:Glutamyl-tRNA(Gln) amidotransferase subunit B, mitochondrial n=1 Tax=Lophiotrema nucula TaxID=690887 RepID=A0A6A5Z7H6_9PLEO|nr:GatB/GatE catalytic domain-containing protein [Lophiotrema nucula]
MLTPPTRSAINSVSKRPYICPSCLHRAQRLPLASATCPIRLSRRALQTATDPPKDDAPFRKLLKDAAKKQRIQEKVNGSPSKPSSISRDPRAEKWELTVGIEIHAELNTARKLFSSATTSANDTPNTHVALFDVAFPGAQPHFQKETLIPAVRAALALNCEIQTRSSFDRKHYFYQDQPAGYQITQYYEPFARDGYVTLHPHDFPGGVSPENGSITIGIKQVQMEQDTAKTVQQPPHTHLLDFNRVSHPLIEIITLPQIHNPTTAAVLVRKVQAILKTADACTAGMEMGGLRADVNVSVRQRNVKSPEDRHSYHGVTGLGQRTEIKNLASVKAVEDAIIAEWNRQIDILEQGGAIEGETRGWTLGSKTTKRLRGKEGEIDYRYMPDPDIAPVLVGDDLIDHLRRTLLSSSDSIIERLTEGPDFNVTSKDASTLLLLDDGDRLDYYLDVVQKLDKMLKSRSIGKPELYSRAGTVAGNWVLMELGALFKDSGWSKDRVPSDELASILQHLLCKEITGRTAKRLLQMKFDGDPRRIERIIDEHHMLLIPMSSEEYKTMAQQILEEKPDVVKDIIEKGQEKKVKWFVGQMMARGKEGTVEASTAEGVLRELLKL